MTLGISSRRRAKSRWFGLAVAVSGLVLVASSAVWAGPVSTAASFEGDDANLVANTTTDWNSFSPVSWSTGTAPYRSSTATAAGWAFRGIEDAQAVTSDTAFAGGTKQDDNCATVTTGKAPNKDDLKRIYIASKSTTTNTYLALAWARIPQNTTSASAHVGFEFNQSQTGCPAGSDGLVQRSAANGGDMLIVYDFEGGTSLPVLKLLRWKTTGICEASGKAATAAGCWVFAIDLTAGGFAEARVNTESATDAIAPGGSDTLQSQEFGEAIVDLTGAGVFPAEPTSCLSFGRTFGVSRSSGNSAQAQMKDLVGPADINVTNCGTVIVRKETIPDENPNSTDFTFSTTVQTLPGPANVANFTLKDDGVKTISNVKPGTGKTVTEADPSPAYALTNITCTGGSPTYNLTTRTATFNVVAGGTVDCTFTNTRQKVQSSMDTAPWVYPNDKATVTAGTGQTDVTGSVTFKLYDTELNCKANGATGLLMPAQTVNLGATAATSKTVNTSNTTLKIESTAQVYWRVSYSGDANHFGRLSDCTENINAVLTSDTGGANVP